MASHRGADAAPTGSGDAGRFAHDERHEEEDDKQSDDECECADIARLSRLHGLDPPSFRTGSRPIRP
jgi:hypothetical protein